MLKLDRRSFLASTAGMSFLSILPRIAHADGHSDTLRVAIAGETGDLDLLQNVSTLSSYSAVFDALIHYGPGGTLEPGLATAWTIPRMACRSFLICAKASASLTARLSTRQLRNGT